MDIEKKYNEALDYLYSFVRLQPNKEFPQCSGKI